jgi:beta-xylosidase
MTNVIKFEPKTEVFAVRVRVGEQPERIIAVDQAWLNTYLKGKNDDHSPLDHLIILENKIDGLVCKEIGNEECYPSMKGYNYCNNNDSFNDFLAILQKDVNKHEE